MRRLKETFNDIYKILLILVFALLMYMTIMFGTLGLLVIGLEYIVK